MGNQNDDIQFERKQFPRYTQPLAPAKPFLVPSFDDEVVEILPSEKPNRKIRFSDNILVQEIENRYAYMYPEDDDEDSYEIEIVDDDGDADFYLEIVDGEVFYVFETEDDISDDESDEDMDIVSESETSTDDERPRGALQLPIGNMLAPNLDDDGSEEQLLLPPPVKAPAPAPVKASPASQPAVPKQPVAVTPAAESDDDEPMSPKKEDENNSGLVRDEAPVSPLGLESAPCTPVQSKKPSLGSLPDAPIVDHVPISPIAGPIAPASPGTNKTPVRSILRACPESPKVSVKKEKKPNKEKKEKTFTKTYVRAEHYDGEHVAYNWEKPEWTKERKLRSTGKGEELRKGGNLANPITFPKKKPANAHLEEEESEEQFEKINTEEVIRRLKGGDSATKGLISLPSYRGRQRNLKFSILGAKIRDGGDLVKPITKATVYRKPEDVNKLARPENLRSTEGGTKVRQGENLAAPVTQATVLKKYEWEKPEWAKARKTQDSEPADPAKPITHIEKDEGRDVNNAANKSLLKPALSAEEKKKKFEWEKPSWAQKPVLRKTDKGEVVRSGDNLARPITQLPDLARQKETVQ